MRDRFLIGGVEIGVSLLLAGALAVALLLTDSFRMILAPYSYAVLALVPFLWAAATFLPDIRPGSHYSYKEAIHLLVVLVLIGQLFLVDTHGSSFFSDTWPAAAALGYLAGCAVAVELASLSITLEHNRLRMNARSTPASSLLLYLVFMPLFVLIVLAVVGAFFLGGEVLVNALEGGSLEEGTVYPLAVLMVLMALVFALVFLAVSWVRGRK